MERTGAVRDFEIVHRYVLDIESDEPSTLILRTRSDCAHTPRPAVVASLGACGPGSDDQGNPVWQRSIPPGRRSLRVTACYRATLSADVAPAPAAAAKDCAPIAPVARARSDTAVRALVDRALRAPGNSGPAADRILRVVSRAMTYDRRFGDDDRDAATALARGRGVCRDYVEVGLAALAEAGIAARACGGLSIRATRRGEWRADHHVWLALFTGAAGWTGHDPTPDNGPSWRLPLAWGDTTAATRAVALSPPSVRRRWRQACLRVTPIGPAGGGAGYGVAE